MERKVIIRGHVFDYEEKAPFVVSGESVLGALEYDPVAEKVKCHECGHWFRYFGNTHLRKTHGLEPQEYRTRHGLNSRSPLCCPAFSVVRSGQHAPSPEHTARLVKVGREYKRIHGNNLTNRKGPQLERMNATSRCQAQMLFRIQVLAAELGRTPTMKEMYAAHIDQPLMVRNFGSQRNAIELAGLEPRLAARPSNGLSAENTCPLPPNFPSKPELLKRKEPWFAVPRCSQRGCIFPAGKTGLCAQHHAMFEYPVYVAGTQSSLSDLAPA